MKNTNNTNLHLTNLLITTPLYLLFFLIPSTCDSPPRYTAIDNIAIDCGSSGSSTAKDGRYWVGDIGLKLSVARLQLNNKSIAFSAVQNQSTTIDTDTVPYFTARIFPTEFTYVFSVTPGQKFIRLHFNPSLYRDFDSSKALFSVKANGFTLLSNFSTASLASGTIAAKEFCINIEEEDQILNITFTPSASTSTTSYNWFAFINGIEVISMPTNLYYTSSENPGFALIGQQNYPFRIESNTALESVYRLNVGGRTIAASQDNMFRSWSTDDMYCSDGVVPVNTSIKINFERIPNYTAPPDLYRTARSMGNNKTKNKSYNLTWNLPVDSGFSYMVRLHFCESQSEITKPADRSFRIFIANQTAEAYADVIFWSGGNGVPYFRDYAVMMLNEGSPNKKNLSIAIHPNSDSSTRYSDAILNGIELFKLSDHDGNLAGNPPAGPNPETPPAKPKSNRTSTLVGAIIGGVLPGVVILSVLGFLIFRRLKGKDSIFRSWWNPFSFAPSKPTNTTDSSSLLSSLCRHFSLAEIKRATNNFDNGFIIGYGGFGDVYKGYIDGGATPVAIKRLKQGSQQGAHEFKTEIEMLSQLRHQHLVSLIGCCNEVPEMILVYDYMARGTLCDHLYSTNNPPLSWKQRIEICIGAAQGLNHLHTGDQQHRIIHRDVKTANILLDENWVAKVSDFGLSKSCKSQSRTHISTNVKGTFGYLDPEYYWTQRLTEKSDVFAFGVVLLEVLCGRPAVDIGLEEEQQHSLCQWALHCINTGKLDQIIDPHLIGKIRPRCLSVFVEIANKCLLGSRVERPTMAGVVDSLELALELQESMDGDAEETLKLGALTHSRSTSSQESISHKLLVRFLSDNGGLNWPKQSTSYGSNTFFLPVDDDLE